MNVQPWATYTPQTYPFAVPPGVLALGAGGGQWPLQGLIGNLINGLVGLGQAIGGLYGQPQFGQQFGPPQLYGQQFAPPPFGQPQYGQQPGQLPFGQPQFGQQFGQPQHYGQPQLYGQVPGALYGLLPLHAAPIMAPGAWGGQLAHLGGQWGPQGLVGNLISGLAGATGQTMGGFPPFQAAHGM